MNHDDLTLAHEWANALESVGLQGAADAVREAAEVQQ
jgi:hypothetical protein